MATVFINFHVAYTMTTTPTLLPVCGSNPSSVDISLFIIKVFIIIFTKGSYLLLEMQIYYEKNH